MIKNTNGWPLEHWLIELCTKCSLKCPRCMRQEQGFPTTNRDLTLDWFKNNFTGLLMSDLRKITFSGVRGDPIYAKHLIEVMRWVRTQNNKVGFVIITNGSYKTKQWWSELSEVLNEKDNIHFSIDGWDQVSNETYRVNCDWKSMMIGVDTLKDTKAYKTWAAIVFKYNQHKIEHMKSLAKSLHFDEFQLTLSSKFNKVYPTYPEDDPLQPDDDYIASGLRHDRIHTRLTNKILYNPSWDTFFERFNKTSTNDSIIPLCMIGNKGLYINASGDFYPCCWTENNYDMSLFGGKNIFNHLANTHKKHSLTEKMNDVTWKKVFVGMRKRSTDKMFGMCAKKCSNQNWNETHATLF